MVVLLVAACAGGPGADQGGSEAPPRSSYAVSVWFEPALPGPGDLAISHESGWGMRCVAPPSGVSLNMPEGPANLTLVLGQETYEHAVKVARGANDFVWHWRR